MNRGNLDGVRGDAVRELALRSLDDPAAAAVLSDLLEERPALNLLVGHPRGLSDSAPNWSGRIVL